MRLESASDWQRLVSGTNGVKRIVLHVHRNPSTGVWSMMKNLAREQNAQPGVLSILGIPADREWLCSTYAEELQHLDLPYILTSVPKIFGTGAFLLSIVANPLRQWLKLIRQSFPAAGIVLHSHSAWLTGGYLPLPLDNRMALVATFHGIADDHRLRNIWWLGKAHRFLAQRLYRSAALLTAVSLDTAIRAEEIFGIPQGAFTVVPNGMTCSGNDPLTSRSSQAGRLIVGHVGQMHHGKGWRLLLEAVDRLRQGGHNVELVLAGKGEDADLAVAEAAKRSGYVRFLGAVPNAAENLIPQLDVLVLASWSEGMPMAIIEAFAAGIPVVATSVGGIPEMVIDNHNGFLVERHVEAIVAALGRFLDDPELACRLRRGAIETFKTKFELSRVIVRYDEIYGAALQTRAAGKQD